MTQAITPIYLNGEWLPPSEARVSVMDRGFLFGDGVYEVIPVYSRKPFRLDEHLARLQQSLDGIQLANPYPQEQWQALVSKLASEAEWEDQSICVQVTRGPMAVRNHAFPAVVTPTVMIMAEPLLTPPEVQRISGIATVSAADIRWLRCDLKATSLLANCLLRQHAATNGCVETVLFRDGFLTEGAASSILVIKNGVLLAPIKNHLMLPGITYDVVLELAAMHGLPLQVRDITEQETRNADELWMASSTKEVLPIATLDGIQVGGHSPVGPDDTPTGDCSDDACAIPQRADVHPADDASVSSRWPIYDKMIAWYQTYKQDVMRR
jgi:D-alanine transaminase